jgi:hypothetical protein
VFTNCDEQPAGFVHSPRLISGVEVNYCKWYGLYSDFVCSLYTHTQNNNDAKVEEVKRQIMLNILYIL